MPNSRLYVPLLGAAAFLYIWGPHPMASGATHDARATIFRSSDVTQAPHTRRDGLTSELSVAVSEKSVRLALNVVNSGARRVELRFPDARTHDFVVLDSTGREVWRWSDGRLFTQTMQNRVVRARDTLTFDTSWRPQQAGRYTAVARLTSASHPMQSRVAFLVR
jgi:hypothetical protein